MRTLGGRIGLALLVFGLATLLAVGGSLWFALRDLHREATIGALTELTVPYSTTVRRLAPNDALRQGGANATRPGENAPQDFIVLHLGQLRHAQALFAPGTQIHLCPPEDLRL